MLHKILCKIHNAFTLHATLYKLFVTMLSSVCKTLNTTLYKPLSTTLHTVLSSVAQMLCTILYIVMCNLWFIMLRKMWAEFTMRYIARNVIQTDYHNVVQCLQNVKHNVVQAIVDNVTLNLARSVIQCRTNHNYAKMLCTILYIIVCNLWFTMLRKMQPKFKNVQC